MICRLVGRFLLHCSDHQSINQSRLPIYKNYAIFRRDSGVEQESYSVHKTTPSSRCITVTPDRDYRRFKAESVGMPSKINNHCLLSQET